MDNKHCISYLEKTLVIDCPNMDIRQRGTDTPIVFSGSGTISQSPTGVLLLKILVQQTTPAEIFRLRRSRTDGLQAGQLMPDHLHFNLTAHSIDGDTWVSEFIPQFSYSHEMDTVVVTAELNRIDKKNVMPVAVNSTGMSLYFAMELEFPCNTSTKIETKIAEERVMSSSSFNVAEFIADEYRFRFRKENGWLVISAHKEAGQLTENLQVRICETLSFIFSRVFYPAIVTIFSPEYKTVTLLSYKDRKIANGNDRPFHTGTFDQTKSFWTLFDKYLKHVLSYEKQYWHPLSGYVISVIRASEASLEAQALNLAIAVEGLSKLYFKDVGKPSAATIEQLTKLRVLVENSELDTDFKKRVEGLIGSMKRPRARDNLEELVRLGLVRTDLVKTWAMLRNAQAHADSQDSQKIAELLRKCHIVRTLFNELVFLSIGYVGYYTDYSTLGFPDRRSMPNSLVSS